MRLVFLFLILLSLNVMADNCDSRYADDIKQMIKSKCRLVADDGFAIEMVSYNKGCKPMEGMKGEDCYIFRTCPIDKKKRGRKGRPLIKYHLEAPELCKRKKPLLKARKDKGFAILNCANDKPKNVTLKTGKKEKVCEF